MLQWLYLGLTACGLCVAVLRYGSVSASLPLPLIYPAFFYIALAGSVVCSLGEVTSREPRTYFICLAVHFLCLLVLLPLAAGAIGVELAVFGGFAFGACIHNPFPFNAILCAAAHGPVMAAEAVILASRGVQGLELLYREAEYGLANAFLVVLASLMVRYHESLAQVARENHRLDELVGQLTRSNLQYLEYAKGVEEASTESERKRITRDIHDIVGYTMTNTVTMMEAITDMMQENPLGVAHIVALARDNAQEGLARVREALHLLRSQEVALPMGRPALERLVRVYQRATGVRVAFAFTEVAWTFAEELDATLYHLVQECLINSFRHGKATQVHVFVTQRDSALELRITDNGIGAADFKEGIGLSGMRERLARLGGVLVAESIAAGFAVTARVPIR